MAYEITVNLIPGLPKEPYNGGIGKYVGVVAHATANYGDSADGERNYESTTWQNAFVHFFVDDQKILQVADTNYICYGAGRTANHLFMSRRSCANQLIRLNSPRLMLSMFGY